MITAATTELSTQVYRVYITTTPEAIWQAITDPEWSVRYGYGGYVDYDLRPGGALRVAPDDEMKAASASMGWTLPDVIIDGEVIEADPPRKLVTTWRMLMDPGTAAEGFTRLTYEIKQHDGGVCSLTVVHDLEGAPNLAALVSGASEVEAGEGGDGGGGGGHAWWLSDLKSLLETGSRMSG
jgi:uncharacterized protein YndB with AHSA1/START domain